MGNPILGISFPRLFGLLVMLALPTASEGAGDAVLGGDGRQAAASSASVRAGLLYDSVQLQDGAMVQAGRHRSVPLAAGLSAVLPGAGQAYNRQWIKAGLGVAVEAVLIYGFAKWRNEGLDGERAFKRQAHSEWSPGQYAAWINDYADFLEQEHGATITFDPLQAPTSVDFTDPNDWSAADWATVNAFFMDIRTAETQLFHPETGASFSHRIPDFGDQQYYELIGKYFQFAPGWDDYPEWRTADGFTDAIDPERTNPDGTKVSVSPTFFEYARDHARSQDFLRRASRITSFIVANHVVAAIDAAVFSRIHNNRLNARLSMAVGPTGEPSPTATIRLTL